MIFYKFNNSFRVEISDEFEEVNLFMFVVGDKHGNIIDNFSLTNGCWHMYNVGDFLTYTEYLIKVYVIRNNKLTEHSVYTFDATNKNIHFNLNACSQEEYDIWVDYLINVFIKNVKCNVYLPKNSNFILNQTSDHLFVLNEDFSPTEFYAMYTIDWNQLHGDPKNSYELINNVLLRI